MANRSNAIYIYTHSSGDSREPSIVELSKGERTKTGGARRMPCIGCTLKGGRTTTNGTLRRVLRRFWGRVLGKGSCKGLAMAFTIKKFGQRLRGGAKRIA